MSLVTWESFTKDIEGYEMSIHKREGPYMHISFALLGEPSGRFEIVSWPGTISIGSLDWTFVFRDVVRGYSKQIPIEPDYWTDRLVSADPRAGYRAGWLRRAVGRQYTSRYLWALHALTYGVVEMVEQMKKEQARREEDEKKPK